MVFGKPLSEVKEEDIQRLVDDQIEENINLDYKKDINTSEKGKKSMAKHVSAFANSRGGFIIYGIEEKKNEYDIPVPDKICGIDCSTDRESIENVILNSIKPRVHISIRRIQFESDPSICILIISIPQSPLAPHMLIKGGENRYYKRINFSSVPMEEYEVRQLFERNYQSREKISQIEESKNGGLRDPNNDSHPWVCMLSIPTAPLENLFVIDENAMQSLQECVRTSFQGLHSFEYNLKPSITGFIAEERINQKLVGILDIGKNGVLEWGSSLLFREPENLSFLEYPFTIELINFLHFAGSFYGQMCYYGYVKFVLGFNNVLNCSVKIPSKLFGILLEFDNSNRFLGNTLLLSREFLASELLEKHKKYARDIMNEFFNAFGEMRSPHFDDEGNFITLD